MWIDSIDTLASAGYDRRIKSFKGSATTADPPGTQGDTKIEKNRCRKMTFGGLPRSQDAAADPPGTQGDTKIEKIDAKVSTMSMCAFVAV